MAPRKEPNYLTLMILALAAVALITSAPPLKPGAFSACSSPPAFSW